MAIATLAGTGNAITINLIDEGGTAGTTAGGGTLSQLFGAAKQVWEAAYGDAHVLTIRYSWAGLGGGTLGVHSLTSQGGAPNRETEGRIRIDNDSTNWFANATPFNNSEYGTFTGWTTNLGGGTMNVGREYTDATGDALGHYDLFSVILHEVGHALGLSSANNAFVAENGDLDIDLQSPRAFAGAQLPTVSGAHLNLTSALMYPSIGTNIRKCPLAADVAANAEISNFELINYNPCAAVPEPATLAVVGLGALGLMRRKRKSA